MVSVLENLHFSLKQNHFCYSYLSEVKGMNINMKKIRNIVICVIVAVLVFLVIKCFVIVGKVTDVEEDIFYITYDDFVLSIPKSYVKSSVKKGNTVIVIYNGEILETYPGRLRKIIYVVKI